MRLTIGYGFVSLALCLLLSASLAAGAPQWISLDGGNEAAPTVQVLDHSGSATVIEVNLHGFWIEEVQEAGEVFQALSLGGLASTMDIGAPRLPTITERVGIPAQSDLRIRVSNLETVALPSFRVYPFQTPTTDEMAEPPFVLDQEAYSKDDLYPAEIAAVSEPQIWRDIRLTELHLTPIRYNPVCGELVVAKSFRVTIEYFGSNPHNALDREPISVNPVFANLYRAGLINFDRMGIDETRLDEPGVKFLFVMKPEAQPYVQPLIDFRHAQGYYTEVRHIESPNFDDEYEIKSYISDLFFHAGLEYVLLVGDAYYAGGPGGVDVPMHMWQGTYSDIWYVSLQGESDYYADLAIGRIVYDTAAELEHQITKTMDYLQNPDLSSNWAENTLLVAHQQQYPGVYTECKEQIATYAYALQIPNFYRAYGGAGATNEMVIRFINTYGTGLLNYRGHGSSTAWSGWSPSGNFTVYHINQLTNVDQYFVHFDVCCDNMNFTGYNGNCFAESMMKAEAAAIAINAAIEPSYTIPNHDYDKEFYKGLYDQGIWNIGYASNYSNVYVVANHGSMGASNYRTYLWLGDACTDLWTNTPQPLAMDYPGTVNLATEDFAVTVTMNGSPVEDALVCAQTTSAYARGWTNSSGVAYLVFSEYPAATTIVTLTATAHNGLPATGSCTVIPTPEPYNLYVDTTPTTPTTIPPTGGSISFTAQVRNDEAYPLEIQGWTDWIYPNSTLHDPFIDRPLNLSPGNLIERSLTFTVSGSEPAGTYTYRLCLGTYQGGAIYGMDSFEFTKSALDEWLGEPGEWVSESALYGWDDEISLDVIALPERHSLSQYPNPFNPETCIFFSLPRDARVQLAIYDLMGRQVALLVDGFRSAGVHEVTFNAQDLASGIYISDLRSEGVHLTSKLVLVK